MNMHWEAHGFELPKLPAQMKWHVFANTAMQPPEDIYEVGTEPELPEQGWIMMGARSVVILVGKG
jgi:glycogen operon protein